MEREVIEVGGKRKRKRKAESGNLSELLGYIPLLPRDLPTTSKYLRSKEKKREARPFLSKTRC